MYDETGSTPNDPVELNAACLADLQHDRRGAECFDTSPSGSDHNRITTSCRFESLPVELRLTPLGDLWVTISATCFLCQKSSSQEHLEFNPDKVKDCFALCRILAEASGLLSGVASNPFWKIGLLLGWLWSTERISRSIDFTTAELDGNVTWSRYVKILCQSWLSAFTTPNLTQGCQQSLLNLSITSTTHESRTTTASENWAEVIKLLRKESVDGTKEVSDKQLFAATVRRAMLDTMHLWVYQLRAEGIFRAPSPETRLACFVLNSMSEELEGWTIARSDGTRVEGDDQSDSPHCFEDLPPVLLGEGREGEV
eukprot:GHVN01022015.1.p1 GENE.GHVN01022015.1~~GHVN01022015.1.p1  ORF type:complete len:312 (+),score=24.02 GHVN01022015.1:361-1296(+)